MKRFENYKNITAQPYSNNYVNMYVKDIMEEAEKVEGMEYVLVRYWLDSSGSMARYADSVYKATVECMKTLAQKNSSAIDCEFICQIIMVADDVQFFNKEPLEPGQLLEVFSKSDYQIGGCTNIGKWIKTLDGDYSRSTGFPSKIKSEYGHKVLNVFISDVVATDDDSSRMKELNRLKNNVHYNNLSKTLCVFLGPESKKGEAELIAGSKDNVIALSNDIATYLTPIVVGSSVTITDSTHINDGDSTTADIAKRAKKDAENGASGAANNKLSPEELQKAMDDILNATA